MIKMSDSEDDDGIKPASRAPAIKNLKIVVLGEANVGKTSLIRRFCCDDFTRQYNQTIGADFYLKRFNLQDLKREINLKITDVGGLELRGPMLANYLFNTNLLIFMYDITNSCSFDALALWMDYVREIEVKTTISCCLIGNKIDLEHQRAVRLDKTKSFLEKHQLFHYLVSAKSGEGVNSAFTDLIAKHLKIPLSKLEREHQANVVVKAELIENQVGKQSTRLTDAATSSDGRKVDTSICRLQ